MSFNCLSCGTYDVTPPRSGEAPSTARCCEIDRCWSGNLTPPPYAHLRSRSIPHNREEAKKGHRKVASIGGPLLGGLAVREEAAAEPRLVRSRGMRRDWSFEDLCNQNVNAVQV